MANRKLRCAVYTRKSSEEGLDQDFNSLDAQREACAAYIMSQRHEGWEPVPDFYDDGGYSGGTMGRPGLQQLLADIEQGRVDTIVVYKVDRLTRSLADFAKIVEILDRRGASFVSVTQSFNTTTSMGRLTLNVLLSFAQFEREVTGERIRDKFAASRAKGMWMGGPVPLGYDLRDRKLIINEIEAATVRRIFERYAALGSTIALEEELADAGITTKARVYKDGRKVGGIPFTHGPLGHVLNNPIYVGDVRHKGQIYPGQHEPIISRELWDKVHALLSHNRVERRIGGKGRAPSLLTGMLKDQRGRIMSPTYAVKGTRRYRYYVTWRATGYAASARVRVPAGELERVVMDLVCKHFWGADGDREASRDTSLLAQRQLLLDAGAEVVLRSDKVSITLATSPSPSDNEPVILEAPVSLVDRGSDVRLAIAADDASAQLNPDPVLLRLIVHAYAARDALLEGRAQPIVASFSAQHLMKLFRLTCLAPDIVTAILEGRQPIQLTGRKLLRAPHIPHCWIEQRRLFGFA